MMRALGAKEYDEMHRLLADCGEHWNAADVQRSVMNLVCELQERAGCAPNARLLELGCGSGCLSLDLARKGFNVTAVDISPVAVARAQQRFCDAGACADLLVADVTEFNALPEFAGCFNYVLDSLLLHNLFGPARGGFFATSYRVLRPGGKLLIMTMCGTPKEATLLTRFDADRRCIVRDGVVELAFLEPDHICKEISAAGFRMQHARIREGCKPGDEDMLLAVAVRGH